MRPDSSLGEVRGLGETRSPSVGEVRGPVGLNHDAKVVAQIEDSAIALEV